MSDTTSTVTSDDVTANYAKNHLPKNLYDFLKWVALVAGYAVLAAYVAIAGYWDLPNTTAIVGTLSALLPLLGVLIGVSSANHTAQVQARNDATVVGSLNLEDSTNGAPTNVYLSVNSLEDLKNKDSVVLKVNEVTTK